MTAKMKKLREDIEAMVDYLGYEYEDFLQHLPEKVLSSGDGLKIQMSAEKAAEDPRQRHIWAIAHRVYQALDELFNPSPVDLMVVLEGGVVTSVVADKPSRLRGVRVWTLDYDVEDGQDSKHLWRVEQGDGTTQVARVVGRRVEKKGIKLAGKVKQTRKKKGRR